MGRLKQLLPYAGKPFVACCVDNLLAAGVGEVVVVTGHRADEVRAAVADRPVRFAHNPDYRGGMSSSVICGVKAVSAAARAVAVALADQPQIGPDLIRRVIEAYETRRPLIVVPTCAGRNGHPIVFDARLRTEVLNLDPDQGLRQVVHAHREDLLRLEVGSDAVLQDCDLPEDYARLTGH